MQPEQSRSHGISDRGQEPGGGAETPATPEVLWASHQQGWKRDSLERELAACREELAAMRSLLDDLPRIFESRFENRLRPLLDQKQQLIEGNATLRDQLRQLPPAAAPLAGGLPPAPGGVPATDGRRGFWSRNLRHAFCLGGMRPV